jgi:hypothetical protein
MAKILFVGDSKPGTTSSHRADAMKRIGYQLTIVDPYLYTTRQIHSRVGHTLHFRTGYVFLQSRLEKWLKDMFENIPHHDGVWVDSGELIGRKCVEILKSKGWPILLYSIDDPTGNRDGRKWTSLFRALPLYDHVVVVRKPSEDGFVARGAKSVSRVYMSYDKEAHKPFPSIENIPREFQSEVAFVGTYMRKEDRDTFLLHLIERGVPLSIWGNGWDRSPLFSRLKAHWRGPSLHGKDYVRALQGSKICIGLLSKGNRDEHTTRTFEVPYAGGLLCAQRTGEHTLLYKEGVEAVFWDDAAECAIQCLKLLQDDKLRESIRLAGWHRVQSLGVENEVMVKSALKQINID